MVAVIGELGKLDASEIHARRLNAKEVFTSKNGESFKFPFADGKRSWSQRIPTKAGPNNESRSQRRTPRKPGEVSTKRNTRSRWSQQWLWSIESDFIYRHHTEPRVHLYVPKEESFPIPLKYFDLTKTTFTSLEGLQAEGYQRLLQRRCGSNFFRIMDRIHEVHVIEWETFSTISVVWGAPCNNSSNYQTWLLVDLDCHVKSS